MKRKLSVLKKIIEKILSSFSTMSLLIAVNWTSLLLLLANFLPNIYLERLHLANFFNNYCYIVVIVFIISFFLSIWSGICFVRKKYQDKKFNEYYTKCQDDFFKDPEALKILYELWQASPDPVWFSMMNQKIKLLKQYGLIANAANQVAVANINNPMVPYILQPVAEEKLKNNQFLNFDYYGLFIKNDIDFNNNNQVTIPLNRALNEYTDENLEGLIYTQDHYISYNVITFPVIFGNEIPNSESKLFYYGKIKNIRQKSYNTLLIYYEILGSIPVEEILNHKEELEIRDCELSSTHWALKDANIVKILKLNY